MGIRVVSDGTSLHQVLIDSDKSDCVSAGDISDVLDGSSHHEHGSLDGFFEKVILLSDLIVGTKNADLLSSSDGSGEDSSEGIETSLIGGGHHLGNVHNKGSLGVTVSHGLGDGIILGSFVQIGGSVLLCSAGGG